MRYSTIKAIDGTIYGHIVKDGRRPLPKELKAQKVCITLTPQAKRRGREMAKRRGLSFSAWVTEKIYTETG